jgi:hypothetical protein
VLLFEFAIHRHEHVDRVPRTLQQFAVLDARPAEALNGRHVVARELRNQIVWDVLVR